MVCPYLILPSMQKHFFFPFPQCLNTFLDILATPKQLTYHSLYEKTFFLGFRLRQNTFMPFLIWLNTFHAIPPTPIHYTWSHLVTPGNTCSHLATPGHNMVTSGHTWQKKFAILPTPKHYTWSHLATPGHLLATPGHILATPVHH